MPRSTLLLLVVVLLSLVSAALCASTPNVVVLAALKGDESNVHYLHPVSLSTSTKSAAVQNVTYDPSHGSTLVFTTDLQGWTAVPLSSSRPSLPLLLWFTGDRGLYLSLDLHSLTPRFHWSYPLDDRMEGHFIYSNYTHSYWSFNAVNDIGSGPCIFVITAFKDVATPGGSPDKAVYQSSTSIGEDTAGIAGLAADQLHDLIFISISTTTFQGATGSLQTFSTVNGTVIADVLVEGAGTFGLHYSEKRRQLFTYRINDGNSQIIGIDVVDWMSGASKNIIAQSALPDLYFFDKPVSTVFDEASGEWYFAVGDEYGHNTTMFSVNVDTKAVSQTVQLVYPSTYPALVTSVMAVYVLPPKMGEEEVKAEMA